MKMPWFLWKGKNSLDDFGVWISKLPSRVRSEERHDEIEIPGRPGTLTMLEGEDVYSAYQSEMTITVRNTINIDPIIEWLRGSSELCLYDDSSKCYDARITDRVEFKRVGNNLRQAIVSLYVQPLRKARFPDENKITLTESSGTGVNPGDVKSKPRVKITGSGNNTVTIDGNAMTFTGISESIIVDCDAQIITSGNSIWTGSFTGEFWELPKGSFTIAQTGSMTIEIEPEWRWF